MNSKPAKIISTDRVKEILLAYGSNPDHWPDDERSAVISTIRHSTELKYLLHEEELLDRAMNPSNQKLSEFERPEPAVVLHLINSLPARKLNDSVQENANGIQQPSHYRSTWFKYAMVAATFFVFITFGSVIVQSPVSTQTASRADNLDQWMWQEISDHYLDESDEPLSFVAFVNFELFHEVE